MWIAPAAALFAVVGCDDGGATTASGGATASSGSASSATQTTTGSTSTSSGQSSSSSGLPGAPHLGAHGLSFYGYQANSNATLDSPALTTQPTGSTLVVSAGRGSLAASAPPTDNKGNAPFVALGVPHAYTKWPTSGTAVYAFEGAVGGPNHVVTNTNEPGDEITLAVVEVQDGAHVQDAEWIEKLEGQPITSAKVTTTAPATLVAFWWGDAGVDGDKMATPNNGFTVIDSLGQAGALVQCFVATKDVGAAGEYDVTWTSNPAQGAQLWLVAVQ